MRLWDRITADFFGHILRVEIASSHILPMTLIDLPVTFHTALYFFGALGTGAGL
jgi:hypothetical protein